MFTSIKRVTYLVPDIAKAKAWYETLLGHKPVFDAPFAVIFTVADAQLILMPSMGHPPAKAEEYVIAWWGVDDIDAAVKRMIEMGATLRADIHTMGDTLSCRVVDPFGNVIGLVCQVTDPQKTSVENQPSQSAYNVTICRVLAAREDNVGVKGTDFLAKVFMSEDTTRVLEDPATRAHVKNMVTAPLFGFIHARTTWLDGVFLRALAEKIPQIVFLGAGYDSRTYRFADRLDGTRVFELDAPATQQRKIRQLKGAGIPIPSQLTFVEANFKHKSLPEVLAATDFDPRKRTLFIWEGVSYYLHIETVSKTLEFIRTHSAPGSILCFDVMTVKREPVYAGEPFLSFIEPDRIRPFLEEHGFEVLEHYRPQDIAQRLNLFPDGTSAGPTLPHTDFVEARIAE